MAADDARLRPSMVERLRLLIAAVRSGDQAALEEWVLQVSHRRRLFAPLAFVVGGLAMLFGGVKLLVLNWRLMLVQILPAMWVWIAMADLRVHALHGASAPDLRGAVLIPIVLVIMAITMLSYFLNAVLAFAIVQPGLPKVRPGFAATRGNLRFILGSGAAVGLALGLAMTVSARWGNLWFVIALGSVIGVMMVTYVAVPARVLGLKSKPSSRDKLVASAVGGALGLIVEAPPYILGRVGLLMIGTSALLLLGIVLIAVAVVLQLGATGAVKVVKMSAKLTERPAGH